MNMIEQRSEEWFKQRIGKITGSRIGAILGYNPWQKPKDVMRAMVREYHGAENEFEGNVATEYGNNFESIAQGDFEIESGKSVIETGFHVAKEHDWIGASPDGLIDDDAILEIKCPFGARENGKFKALSEQMHYFSQVQFEMYCTNRTKAYFYQWSHVNTILETVEINTSWIQDKILVLREFYNDYLKQIKNPDEHLVDLIQTKEAVELANAYRAFKEDMAQAKVFMDDAKSQLIELADGKKTNISGVLVYPIERKGTINYKKIPELKDVDLEQYRGNSSTSWGVR